MNRQILILEIIGITLIILAIAGLGSLTDIIEEEQTNTELKKFIGKWKPCIRPLPLDCTFTFREDKTFTYQECVFLHITEDIEYKNGTYIVENGIITLNYENSGQQIFTYIFSKDNNYVTLIDETFNVEEDPNVLQYTWHK